MKDIIDLLNSFVWHEALVYLCLGAGLYFSFATRFLQIRHVPHMIQLLFKGHSSKKGLSSFQALAMSISGRVGTGNIAGVAAAIGMGGPGAIFWMWTIAFLGASSACVESVLAQIYKEENDGQYRGGPAYFIEKALGMRWYALTFAAATLLSTGLFLPTLQSNSIAIAVNNAFGISEAITAGALVSIIGFIIFGGVKRISHVAEFVVPFMALAYIIVAIVIIVLNIDRLPGVFSLILSSAFSMDAAFGAMFGEAIAWGVKRGIYSNEAGQGTGPHHAAAAEVEHPTQQGFVQAFSVYVDTLFVCTATALMILICNTYNVINPVDGSFIVNNLGDVEIGPEFTQAAVESMFPGYGAPFVAISLFFFSFTTIMAYYYISECNVAYLSRGGESRILINVLRVALLGSVAYGTFRSAELAWAIGDLGVGIMAWLNIIAILLLRKKALATIKDYEVQLKDKVSLPSFRPKLLGILGATVWDSKDDQEDKNFSPPSQLAQK